MVAVATWSAQIVLSTFISSSLQVNMKGCDKIHLERNKREQIAESRCYHKDKIKGFFPQINTMDSNAISLLKIYNQKHLRKRGKIHGFQNKKCLIFQLCWWCDTHLSTCIRSWYWEPIIWHTILKQSSSALLIKRQADATLKSYSIIFLHRSTDFRM